MELEMGMMESQLDSTCSSKKFASKNKDHMEDDNNRRPARAVRRRKYRNAYRLVERMRR